MSAPNAKVNTFSLPGGSNGRGLAICGLLMAFSCRKEIIMPGSPIYDYLLAGRPQALDIAAKAQAFFFYSLFGTHALELPLFLYIRLAKNGPPLFSWLWVKWAATSFVGGQFVWRHYDSLAQESLLKKA